MSSKWKHSLQQPSQHSLTLQLCSSRKKPASLWPWGLCCWPLFSSQDCLPVWLFRSLVLTMPSAEHCGELRLPICVRLCLFCVWIYMFVLFFSRNVQFTVISNESLRDLTPKCRSSFCFNVNPPKLWYFSRLFATPCAEISTKLIKQIQDFNPLTGCDECHYMVRSTSVNVNDVFFSMGGKRSELNINVREKYIFVLWRAVSCSRSCQPPINLSKPTTRLRMAFSVRTSPCHWAPPYWPEAAACLWVSVMPIL